jgi:hypothetical protein
VLVVSVCWLESKEQRDRGKSVVMRWLIVDHGRAPHQVFLASVFPYRLWVVDIAPALAELEEQCTDQWIQIGHGQPAP